MQTSTRPPAFPSPPPPPATLAANEKLASGPQSSLTELNVWQTQTFTPQMQWGNDYMHARYYSSGLGRFLSVDPVGGTVGSSQSWNRYSYVLNNPIRGIDPNGQDFLDFANGVANGFGSTMLANAGRQSYANSHFAIGQSVGDAAGAVVGALEVFVGAGGDVGGVALTATGAGAPVGIPVVAASTGLILHGATAASTGVANLTSTLMSSSGGTGSGKVDDALTQISESGAEVKVNPKTDNQEGNVTIDFGEEGRVNLRVETHPLEPGGSPVRHGNVEVVTETAGKKKVINHHITE